MRERKKEKTVTYLGNGINDAAHGENALHRSLLVIADSAFRTGHLPDFGHILTALAYDGGGLRARDHGADVNPCSLVVCSRRGTRLGLSEGCAGGAADGLGLGRIHDQGVALGIRDLGLLPVRLGTAVRFENRERRKGGIAIASRDGLVDLILVLDDFVEGRSLGLGLVGNGRRGSLLQGPLRGVCRLG